MSLYYVTNGGITSPGIGYLNIIVIFAAVILGVLGAGVVGVLCVITLFGFYWATSMGRVLPMQPSLSHLFGTQATVLVSLTLLMIVAERSVQRALMRARSGERELTRRNEQLQREIAQREIAQQEQARLVAILEATPDFVAMSDLQGKVLYLNRGGRKLVGAAADADLSTANVSDFRSPEITPFVFEQAIPIAVERGIWSGETTLRTRDGRDIPVSQVIIAHRGQDGSVEFLSTIMRDISDRKQAEQQRLEIALQEERFNSFKEFLGDVSHDLRTPLTTVQTSLYLIERLEDPARRHEKIEVIQQQMGLVEKYMQELLDLIRLNRAPEFNLVPLDLNYLLDEIRTSLAPTADAQKVTLRVTPDAQPAAVLADRPELNRALANLVENAIQYTPAGGKVELDVRQQDDNVKLRIADTGIGIDPADITHIFERFYRAAPAKVVRSGGTGLGLAIVKRIIEVHGGSIGVESTPGLGTTFTITLPLYQTTSSESTPSS